MARPRDAPGLVGVRILLVEDDPDTLEVLGLFLTGEGAVVITAVSGDEGLRLFLRERPDLVMSDVRMANGDGYSLVRRIRALAADEGGLTPAIALSANAALADCLEAGFHVYVRKPFQSVHLLDVLRDFVRADDTRRASWTLARFAPTQLLLTIVGYATAADARFIIGAVTEQLSSGAGPQDIVVDLRAVTGFSPAGPSVAERAIWPKRRSIRSVTIVGGPFLARATSRAACALVGIACTLAQALPEPDVGAQASERR